MNEQNNELIDEIKESLSIVHKKPEAIGQTEWTHTFLYELKRIGLYAGYRVYSSSTGASIPQEEGGSEWLYDLLWSIESGEKDGWKNNWKGLKLICESEWSPKIDDILYDFQKLAVGKADIKIMIFQCENKDVFNDIVDKCRRSIDETLINDNSTYLFFGSSNEEGSSLYCAVNFTQE